MANNYYERRQQLSYLRNLANEMAGVHEAISPDMHQVAIETAQDLYEGLKLDWDLEIVR